MVIDEKRNNQNKNNQKKDEHRQNIDFFTSFDLANRVYQKVHRQGGCRRKKQTNNQSKNKNKTTNEETITKHGFFSHLST